jgi:tRNA(Leu) C34 or U34 (ribose-2'-O)-methylase TrmL
MRGYACIALDNPKTPANIGAACRAAHVYDAGLIVVSGQRFKRSGTDTTKAWRHVPLVETADVFDAIPFDCVPVAVDLVDGAHPLPRYVHPERAFYIFGAEDGTLGRRILDRCRDKIMVPTKFCMNLAATVNVVLYDRMCKGVA